MTDSIKVKITVIEILEHVDIVELPVELHNATEDDIVDWIIDDDVMDNSIGERLSYKVNSIDRLLNESQVSK